MVGPEAEETALVKRAARLFTTTTGHSQIGEFVPSKRTIVVGETRFENTLWKDDVYLNPNRPQYGTWKFSRAGWAPGDVVWPWWIDLTDLIQPGQPAELTYEPQPYDFSGSPQKPEQKQINQASHVVRSYLIEYREPTGSMPAPSGAPASRLNVSTFAGVSGSLAVAMNESVSPSSTDWFPIGASTGDSLTSFTVIPIVSKSSSDGVPSSATRTVTV